jgi:hypothetical protein
MKNSTLLKLLGFPCCDSHVVTDGESTLKFDFSEKTREENHTKSSSSKSNGITSIIMLFVLFLFTNLLTAQVSVKID